MINPLKPLWEAHHINMRRAVDSGPTKCLVCGEDLRRGRPDEAVLCVHPEREEESLHVHYHRACVEDEFTMYLLADRELYDFIHYGFLGGFGYIED